METLRICKQCRQPLPDNAPEGLCPACLAKVALGTEPAATGDTINVNPRAEAAPGTRVPPDVTQLAAQFPQLEILELLGMGGMGMVYKARQPRLDRFVALKILPVDSATHPSFAERFNREAKALAKLNHPGIVAVYDFGQTGHYYYFVMEYVDGMNLRQLLRTQTLEPRQALELVAQICTALQFAHDEGIVHRDIKPENILLNKKGQVKIADFGLAKLLGTASDTTLTMSQAAMGTFNYMAPEQREDAQKVDHRADIYSLGVVFYEMLTGEVPMGRFEAPSKKVRIDVRLDQVVLHALEREPARRYQHVSEIKTGVDTITSTMPPEKKDGGAHEPFKPQPPPGFASYVLKRSGILVLGWLAAVLCLHWAPEIDEHSFLPIRFLFIVLILASALGKFLVPIGLVLIVYAWLEARERRGLSPRQLPPPIRRRLWLWWAVSGGGFGAVVVATTWVVLVVFSSGITHEATTEWWFFPSSGGYEKLGLRATFSSVQKNGKTFYEAPTNCTVSLIVQRKEMEPSVLNVGLPGLRAEYGIRATNSWPTTFILDTDTLVEWLHKVAGLDTATPKFQEQASEVYGLLKQYQNESPHTAKEFLNEAISGLRDFSFGGYTTPRSVWGDIGFFARQAWVLWLFVGESLLYLAAASWATRRVYRVAWAEIETGQWIPPAASKRFPTAIKV